MSRLRNFPQRSYAHRPLAGCLADRDAANGIQHFTTVAIAYPADLRQPEMPWRSVHGSVLTAGDGFSCGKHLLQIFSGEIETVNDDRGNFLGIGDIVKRICIE